MKKYDTFLAWQTAGDLPAVFMNEDGQSEGWNRQCKYDEENSDI